MAQGINIKGEFQGQVIITSLLAINNNLARMNVHLQKQSSLTRQLVAGHKSAAGAATGAATGAGASALSLSASALNSTGKSAFTASTNFFNPARV